MYIINEYPLKTSVVSSESLRAVWFISHERVGFSTQAMSPLRACEEHTRYYKVPIGDIMRIIRRFRSYLSIYPI